MLWQHRRKQWHYVFMSLLSNMRGPRLKTPLLLLLLLLSSLTEKGRTGNKLSSFWKQHFSLTCLLLGFCFNLILLLLLQQTLLHDSKFSSCSKKPVLMRLFACFEMNLKSQSRAEQSRYVNGNKTQHVELFSSFNFPFGWNQAKNPGLSLESVFFFEVSWRLIS